jgi:deoxyribonuclease-4
MELEFVRGARMGLDLARRIGERARALDVSLSAHAPYYINLLSEKPETRDASVERILQTARIVHAAGGGRIAYHPAYIGKYAPEASLKELTRIHADLLARMDREKITTAVLAPETAGGKAEWGGLDELLALCAEFDRKRVNPTLDFSHLHCRSGKGWLYTKSDYSKVFDRVEKALGRKAVESFHAHFQSVHYTDRGEHHHLTIDHDEPPFAPLAELLAEQGYTGTIISESPNIEADALKMQRTYERALKR